MPTPAESDLLNKLDYFPQGSIEVRASARIRKLETRVAELEAANATMLAMLGGDMGVSHTTAPEGK